MVFIIKRIAKGLIVVSRYSPFSLFWMGKAFMWDWPVKLISRYKLPGIAKSMGLAHRPSDVIKEFGELAGTIDGFRVTVRPENNVEPVIEIESKHDLVRQKFEISNSRPYMRPEKNIINFKTGNRKFNSIFRTRRSHKDFAATIIRNHGFLESAVSFYLKWIFKIEYIGIDEQRIFCKLNYGFNLFPHIPFYRLKGLVNELVGVMKYMERMY